MKRMFFYVIIGLLAGTTLGLHSELRQARSLRQSNDRLRVELETVARSAGVEAKNDQARRNEDIERLRLEASEVLKLRNETSQLRAKTNELEKLRAENQQLRELAQRAQTDSSRPAATQPATASQEGFWAKENWGFTGYATPEAALQSAVWAMREGDISTFLGSLAPEDQARLRQKWADKSEAEVSAKNREQISKISAIRVLESKVLSDSEAELRIYAVGGEDKVQRVPMIRVGTEWKLARLPD